MSSMREGLLLGLGLPCVDLLAHVDSSFIDKYSYSFSFYYIQTDVLHYRETRIWREEGINGNFKVWLIFHAWKMFAISFLEMFRHALSFNWIGICNEFLKNDMLFQLGLLLTWNSKASIYLFHVIALQLLN